MSPVHFYFFFLDFRHFYQTYITPTFFSQGFVFVFSVYRGPYETAEQTMLLFPSGIQGLFSVLTPIYSGVILQCVIKINKKKNNLMLWIIKE